MPPWYDEREDRKRGQMKIYDVHYMNYFPREIESLHLTEVDAEKRAEELDGDWRVGFMEIPVDGDIETLMDSLRARITELEDKLAIAEKRLEIAEDALAVYDIVHADGKCTKAHTALAAMDAITNDVGGIIKKDGE